jgi:hypothetical protein
MKKKSEFVSVGHVIPTEGDDAEEQQRLADAVRIAFNKNLLIAVDGKKYLVTNPAIGDALEVEYLPGDTPETLITRIETMKNEPGNGILKQQNGRN